MAHGTADATGAGSGRVILTESAFDEADAGLGEGVVVLSQRGGEGDAFRALGFRSEID